jgi:hypothetical protein
MLSGGRVGLRAGGPEGAGPVGRHPPKSRIEPVNDMSRGDNAVSAQSVFERAAATPDVLAAPGLSFDHPSEVLARVETPLAERRAILAAWASDAHAVEDAPHLRQLENGARVPVSEILEALRQLDAEAELGPCAAWPVAKPGAASDRR